MSKSETDAAVENFAKAMADLIVHINTASAGLSSTASKTTAVKQDKPAAKPKAQDAPPAEKTPVKEAQDAPTDDPFTATATTGDDPFATPPAKKEEGLTFDGVSKKFFSDLQKIAEYVGPEAAQNASRNILTKHLGAGVEFNKDNVPVRCWVPLLQDIQGTLELAKQRAGK